MQVKDIPEGQLLLFLSGLTRWATIFPDCPHSILNAMPPDTPPKVALAKMAALIRRGLVCGCTCGCRGDFEITTKGRAWLHSQVAGQLLAEGNHA